ncbi:C39 family peptidase [Promicromonospora sp. Populi]|uniref:C39 family peptidase n=1 Tax=Promicromonospora sp. Populi TaxID=3239420 RepID=UPI0034E2ACAE
MRDALDVTASEDRIPLSDPAAQEQVAHALITAASLPGLTASEKLQIEAELAKLSKVNPALASSTRAALSSPYALSAVSAVPDTLLLPTVHQAQAKSYWCGPATASMIVKYKGKTHTQTTMARVEYLKTEENGATTWASGLMTVGLNKALATAQYQQVQAPSATTLKGAMVDSLNALYPVALDTVEFAGGQHYNGHPVDRTIGHWIVGNGYSNAGSTLQFMDPATSYYPDAEPTFALSTTGMAVYLQSNGIAW